MCRRLEDFKEVHLSDSQEIPDTCTRNSASQAWIWTFIQADDNFCDLVDPLSKFFTATTNLHRRENLPNLNRKLGLREVTDDVCLRKRQLVAEYCV